MIANAGGGLFGDAADVNIELGASFATPPTVGEHSPPLRRHSSSKASGARYCLLATSTSFITITTTIIDTTIPKIMTTLHHDEMELRKDHRFPCAKIFIVLEERCFPLLYLKQRTKTKMLK